MGIEAELVSMPLSAEPKNVYIDIPTADGELDLSKVNSANRILYKPRMIEFLCHANFDPAKDDFESRAKYLASILCADGDRDLRIAGSSTFIYKGRASNLYNITPESDTSFSFPLVFRCQPFRWAGSSATTAGSNGQVTVTNGGLSTDFRMEIEGTLSSAITLTSSSYPGKELKIPSLGSGKLVIDTDEARVYFAGSDITNRCSGDFFLLAPGGNTIKASGVNGSTRISLTYTEKYL